MVKFGIDVGGTKTAYGLFDEDGKILDMLIVASDKEAISEAFFDGIADKICVLVHNNHLTMPIMDASMLVN